MKARSETDWEAVIREYLRIQRETDGKLSLAAYAAMLNVDYPRLRKQFYTRSVAAWDGERVMRNEAHPSDVAVVLERLPTESKRCHKAPLSETDIAILRDLAHDRCCSIDVLARRHWGGDIKRATQHLQMLHRRRQIEFVHRDTSVAYLSRRGARLIGAPTPRRMHPRHVGHHVATLRALEDIKERLAREGAQIVPMNVDGKMVPYMAEIHVQAQERAAQSRRGTARGESYATAPDAVIQVKGSDGSVETVAVEYVTAKYSDEQISEKSGLARHYDRVVFVADSARTAGRVNAMTNCGCEIVGSP